MYIVGSYGLGAACVALLTCRASALPLQAVCHVLRDARHRCNRIKTVASLPQHRSDKGRSDTIAGGGRLAGRTVEEHGSHRHVTGKHRVKM